MDIAGRSYVCTNAKCKSRIHSGGFSRCIKKHAVDKTFYLREIPKKKKIYALGPWNLWMKSSGNFQHTKIADGD